MKIIVCVKQVPDTSEVQIDPQTNTLIRAGIPVIINPDDKSAIEAALAIRDAVEGSTVTVLTMGPRQAEMALQEALSMGCDEAVLVSSSKFGGSDTRATSTILAAAIKKIGFDLVLAGRQAIDGDTAQVGPQIAEHLHIPQVCYAEEITPKDGAFIVKRQFEECYQIIKVKAPCLMTVISELGKPRYMTVGGIVEAENREITVLDFDALSDLIDPLTIGLKGSPTKVVRSYTKEPKSQGAILKGLSTEDAVDVIMAHLHESHLL